MYLKNLARLNDTGRVPSHLPYKRIAELELQKIYRISRMRMVNTKHGRQVIADIGLDFSVFMPLRVSFFLNYNDEVFDKIAEHCEKKGLGLRYLGSVYNRIEFIDLNCT